jgi:hypothetical protein
MVASKVPVSDGVKITSKVSQLPGGITTGKVGTLLKV